MAIPVWVPGQVLTAADINSWLVPNGVTKTSNQSVTSSTALVNDTALVLPVVANATYAVTFTLFYEGGTLNASDIKVQWAVPGGGANLSLCVAAYLFTDGALHGAAYLTAAAPLANGTSGAGVIRSTLMTGCLSTGSTSGSIQFQWAQNTSSATATIVHAGSSLQLQRTS